MQLELQRMLLEQEPSRRALLSYQPIWPKDFHVQVFRNHAFEMVEHMLGAYLDYARMGISFSYSGYNDSFSFLELDKEADMILIWIDTTRYRLQSVQDFLEDRLSQLRRQYKKPVLVIPFGEALRSGQSGVTVWNLTELRSLLGETFEDRRAQKVTGTPLSGKAMLTVAKELGLRYLPALLRPRLKAVVVDLDYTLYRGVLGEDGAAGLQLTDGHRQLQQQLKMLSEQGIFLCAVSKNDPRDVQELLQNRTDFPLRAENFSRIAASWEPKPDAIGKIAAFLNIGVDSMVFIDDNIGELAAVQMAFSQIGLIHALEDAAVTGRVLDYYPGLLQLIRSEADAGRKADIMANEERQVLQRELPYEEYLRSLAIRLTFTLQNRKQITRMAELANKTNQFIFNYKRYTQAEMEEMLCSPEYVVVSVSLADKLSDSGLVGVCVGRREGEYMVLEECFVSCRALGRGIERIIVCTAIAEMMAYLRCEKLLVRFQSGPRNRPAKDFTAANLFEYLEEAGPFSYTPPEGLVHIEKIYPEEGGAR